MDSDILLTNQIEPGQKEQTERTAQIEQTEQMEHTEHTKLIEQTEETVQKKPLSFKKIRIKLVYFFALLIIINITFDNSFSSKSIKIKESWSNKDAKIVPINSPNIMNFTYDGREIPVTAINKNDKANDLKVALCTMGKFENLYVKEYVDYYVKLGIDHLFIYDDNDPNTED